MSASSISTAVRRIAVVTTSRADYCHLYWPLRRLQAEAAIDLQLIVSGAHLSGRFGNTVREIEADGFEIHARVPCLEDSDADTDMARTIGAATLGMTDALARLRPDLLLLIADRYEMLAPAAVAVALRIPIAHIEGGEISEGAIDDAIRNALTKLAHIHFTPTAAARGRVLAMGEEPWRVHCTGAPSLDYLQNSQLLTRDALARELDISLAGTVTVVALHPVTLQQDTTCEIEAVFAALGSLDGSIVFCFPNADAGSFRIIERARVFCTHHPLAKLFVNLPALRYWSLLGQADLMVGNSSSGIMETPAMALPTVNIGDRQRGRERAANIIDCTAREGVIVDAIKQARTPMFRQSLSDMHNPWGDGRAGQRICSVLKALPERERLLNKRAGVPPSSPWQFPARPGAI